MNRMTNCFRALAVAATLSLGMLAGCGSEEEPKVEQCQTEEVACGEKCCAANERCDAASSTCKPAEQTECAAQEIVCGEQCCVSGERCDAASATCKPVEQSKCAAEETVCGEQCCGTGERCNAVSSICEAVDQPGQLERCYSPASFSSSAFASSPSYLVDEDGYEYMAKHSVDAFGQMLSVALWPLSETTRLTGVFDLSKEPFDYASCERCVLVIAGRSAEDEKHYLARQGTLTVTEVNSKRISGKLAGVRLVEVEIDDDSLATKLVDGGCEIEIPALSFVYGEPVDPVPERIQQCFLPETLGSDQFRDFIIGLDANDAGYFYRAMEFPAQSGYPGLTLFVEVFKEGIGSFSLKGAEVDCETCYHFVIIEAQSTAGPRKDFVSSGGTLVLDELSDTVMRGRLQNVTLVEADLSDGFVPVPGGCTTFIEKLEFDSREETVLED